MFRKLFHPFCVSLALWGVFWVCVSPSSSPLAADNAESLAGAPPASASITADTTVQPAQQRLPHLLFTLLPPDLTPVQRTAALQILHKATPRIESIKEDIRRIRGALHGLSFSASNQSDSLPRLGQELVTARDALQQELRRVSTELEKAIGHNPQWGDMRRSCSMPVGK